MKIEDNALREWLWAWEVLRRLGFQGDELHFIHGPPGRYSEDGGRTFKVSELPLIAIEARRRGQRFTWVIGGTTIPEDKISEMYEAACDAWNNGSIEGMTMDDFKKSASFKNGTAALLVVTQKGMLG